MTSVGLVGSGFWAETIHAPAIAALDGAAVRGIWGRNATARDRIAASLGLQAFDRFEELVTAVDIVDLAVPPATQVSMAVAAAGAGKHLLLEKPMALSVPEALQLEAAVTEAGVVALLFLTRLFEPVRSAWLRDQASAGHTRGHVEWISAALSAGSPYAASPWRREGGALWDVGPHIHSQLVAVLGPVTHVSVIDHDPVGMTRLSLVHEGGATSSVHMTVHADPADKAEVFEFSGPGGHARSPDTPLDFPASFRDALATLVQMVEDRSIAPDPATTVRAGVGQTAVLGAIETAIHEGIRGALVPVMGTA